MSQLVVMQNLCNLRQWSLLLPHSNHRWLGILPCFLLVHSLIFWEQPGPGRLKTYLPICHYFLNYSEKFVYLPDYSLSISYIIIYRQQSQIDQSKYSGVLSSNILWPCWCLECLIICSGCVGRSNSVVSRDKAWLTLIMRKYETSSCKKTDFSFFLLLSYCTSYFYTLRIIF